jgi:cytochrome c
MKFRHSLAACAGLFAICSALPAMAEDQLALAKAKGCTNCHAVDKKVIGPAYKDVAAKYKGDSAGAAKLAEKVVKGGGGVWGPIPMPPNKVTPDEAKKLVDWVLSI